MAHGQTDRELDSDGIGIQRYDSTFLVVVPESGFGDQILRYARSSLYNIHVGTRVVTARPDVPVKGRLQDEFLCDGGLDGLRASEFEGVILAGCEGEHPYAANQTVLGLVREAHGAQKILAAWGNALAILGAAGVVKGRRVTGDPASKDAVLRAGAKFTGRQIEVSQHLITAFDEGSGMRFGQALVDAVRAR